MDLRKALIEAVNGMYRDEAVRLGITVDELKSRRKAEAEAQMTNYAKWWDSLSPEQREAVRQGRQEDLDSYYALIVEG